MPRPGEALDHFVLESTDGPVEHVRVRCVARHLFLMPAERLEGGDPATAVGGAPTLGSSAVADPFAQDTYGVRLDWGPAGARATRADLSVVVDVLGFSTSVTVAVERGMRVYPYRWRDDRAEAFAAGNDAVLAVGRAASERPGAPVAPSLSPASLLACSAVPRLVLPSPNGSSIAAVLGEDGCLVAAGCLRNARAVAAWLGDALDDGRTVAVIAAGERWDGDDSLRPALEDHLGAGAILADLARRGHAERMSPEAGAAVDVFEARRGRLEETIRTCVGARELAAGGFDADVDVAAALDVSSVVPVLRDGAFAPSA